MISFANPSWLYGLLGLLIPIGIHLLSRREGRTVFIGSIRHLTDSDTAQFSSIRLNEILLLVLRMILITLLVFILAGFNFESDNDDAQQWLVIEKGVEQEKSYLALIDSLSKRGFEIHWLAQGFPALADSISISAEKNYFEILRTLPSSVDTTVVISYTFARYFKGETIALPENVTWLSIDDEKSEAAVDAIRISQDSIAIRVLQTASTGSALAYFKISTQSFSSIKRADSLVIRNQDTINISVYFSPKFEYDNKIIMAALQAIAASTPHKLKIQSVSDSTSISSHADFIFWLADEKSTLKNKIVIGYSPCENKNLPLVVPHDYASHLCINPGFEWILTQRLNEENVLRESFSYSLSKIVLPKNDMQKPENLDQRTIPVAASFRESISEKPTSLHEKKVKATSESLLAILLFIVLIAERLIANQRNQ